MKQKAFVLRTGPKYQSSLDESKGSDALQKGPDANNEVDDVAK